MPARYDFKKEWVKTKDQLSKLSKEALVIAKKGERELIEISRKSKIHVDATALTLKKEHLYYMIGKEYSALQDKNKPSVTLTKLVGELSKANRQQLVLKRRIKTNKKQLC